MLRKKLLSFIASAALISVFGAAAFAQSAELRGKVFTVGPNGAKTPVANAAVDVVRTDMSGHYETKTNKNGEFAFAGVLLGTYAVAASAPGFAPNFLAGVKPGREPVEIILSAGDGKRLTRDEIKNYAARTSASSSTGMSEADKQKQKEAEEKNREIAAKNEKIKEANQVISDNFVAGNEALLAKRFDDAVAAYDRALAIDAEHPMVPVLLTNKSIAFLQRGVSTYNAAVKTTDDGTQKQKMEEARADFRTAAEVGSKAVESVKLLPVETDLAAQAQRNDQVLRALSAKAEAYRLFVSKVDPSKADEGVTAFQDYMAAEQDAAKKSKAQLDLAKMLFDANSYERAIGEYQKVLSANPDSADALFYSALALYNIGSMTGDKAKTQEAANFLARYIDKAPDNDPNKQSAKETLEYLKSAENIKPEKTTTPAPPKKKKP